MSLYLTGPCGSWSLMRCLTSSVIQWILSQPEKVFLPWYLFYLVTLAKFRLEYTIMYMTNNVSARCSWWNGAKILRSEDFFSFFYTINHWIRWKNKLTNLYRYKITQCGDLHYKGYRTSGTLYNEYHKSRYILVL